MGLSDLVRQHQGHAGASDGAKGPLVCLEVNPPRGTDVEAVLARYAQQGELLKRLHLVNITDSALAKMRLSGIVFASLFKHRFGVEPVVNVACRDRNVIALQADLLGAWALGIRSVVALTGDAVGVGDLPDAKGVFEVNSVGLLQLIATLNGGRDMAGVELKGAPAFLPGVVVNPNVKNRDAEIKRLVRKRDAGARYALTQPVFDEEQAADFFEAAAATGVELLVGLMPFRTARGLEGIAKVPGIKVPEGALEKVKATPEGEVPELSCDMAVSVAKRVSPYVKGFHVVSGGAPLLALRLCERLFSDLENV